MSSSPEFPSPRRLKVGAKDQLWSPESGIRFAPIPSVQTPPKSSVSKSIQSPVETSKSAKLEEEDYFTDDEDFERLAGEWYDELESSMAEIPSPSKSAEQVKAAIGQYSTPTRPTPTRPTSTRKDEPQVLVVKVDKNLEKEPEKKTDKKVEEPVVPPGPPSPPASDCEFNISKDLFEAALKSKPGTPESFWSYTMYSQPLKDDTRETVKVNYCTNEKNMEWVLKKYFLDEAVLGFDLEWSTSPKRRPGVRDNVSLIQLASASRIVLIHAAVFPRNDFTFPTLKKIMEDDKVSKVGVNIKGDCTRLETNTSIKTKGIFELSHLYKLVKYSKEKNFQLVNRKLVSLATQTQEFLRLPLFKGQDVRMSTWSRPLVGKQITYAANDAYAALQLYHVLEAERLKLDPCPPRPRFAEEGLPIEVAIPVEEVEEVPDELADELDPDTETGLFPLADTTDLETLVASGEFSDDLSDEYSDESPSQESSAAPSQDLLIDKTMLIAMRKQINSHITSTDQRVNFAKTKTLAYIEAWEGRPVKDVGQQPQNLLSYFLWHHHEDLTLLDILGLLQRSDSKVQYLAKDVFRCVTLHTLPYSEERFKKEILPHVRNQGDRKIEGVTLS